MSAEDTDLFATKIRVENKDLFVDLKKNKSGTYLKISERNGSSRSTILIPASGIQALRGSLDEVLKAIGTEGIAKTVREPKARTPTDPEVSARSIYVTGLPWETTDEELATHFESAGTVVKATILRNRRGGRERSMGCGIIEFSSREEASDAISNFHETELSSRTIKCREDRIQTLREVSESAPAEQQAPAATRPPRKTKKAAVVASEGASEERIADPTKIFVKNLPWETTDQDLIDFFSTVGSVKAATVQANKKGRSMGSGIVEFDDAASVQAAIQDKHQNDLKGRSIGVRAYYQS